MAKWHRELEIFTKIKPIIILDGNVLDVYQYPVDGTTVKGSIVRLTDYLYYFFMDRGYKSIVEYDSLQGFHNDCNPDMVDSFAELCGAGGTSRTMARSAGTQGASRSVPSGYSIAAPFKGAGKGSAPDLIRKSMAQHERPSAVILNMASRYIPTPDNLTQEEVDSFTSLVHGSLEAKDVRSGDGTLKNVLVMVVNKLNDLPAWFYLQNPNVKTISINTPSKEERELLVKGDNFETFFEKMTYQEDKAYYEQNLQELEKIQDKFVALTSGFCFTELNGLRRLCKNERLHIHEMCEVIDLYRYGIRENPWKLLDLDEIRNGKTHFEERVKGQSVAQEKTLDIMKRAIVGLSGAQGSSHNRPKGVLFFAGPTGTGKTETAKTLAEIIFGHEDRCIRFDMSEYSQSHSDQKLLGAPPGYVGYEAGGQLTNAVRENPFSILLFDEIEKAHPSILDKFLQILEDGRMTDGQGRTVYFSECIIIFTSNLGIYTVDQYGRRQENVSMDMAYEEVSARIRSTIEEYFKLQLGRPEILNRIGDNIVIFDYIRRDVADQILNSQLKKICRTMADEKQITLEVSAESRETLKEYAYRNLQNGGRGIGNVVESMFINPLSRFLFDHNVFDNARVEVLAIDTMSSPAVISGKIRENAEEGER